MTSAKTKSTNRIQKLRLTLLGLAAMILGVGFLMASPSNAQASVNPDFTGLTAAADKLGNVAVDKAVRSIAIPGKRSVNQLGLTPGAVKTRHLNKLADLNAKSKVVDQSSGVNGDSNSVSAGLAPPDGTHKTLPQASQTNQTRKFIAKQDKKKNRWVEVDISRQRIMLWEGTHLKDSYLVSTGLYGRDTPLGTYHVYLHIRSQTMSGPGYSLPNVQYVQYFYGDYSLHGTWWHNNYGHRMSHGCVNLPTYKARELWYWSPARLKVVIHQ